MSLKQLRTCRAEEISLRSSDSSPTDSKQLAGVSAMSVLKRSADGLKAVFHHHRLPIERKAEA